MRPPAHRGRDRLGAAPRWLTRGIRPAGLCDNGARLSGRRLPDPCFLSTHKRSLNAVTTTNNRRSDFLLGGRKDLSTVLTSKPRAAAQIQSPAASTSASTACRSVFFDDRERPVFRAEDAGRSVAAYAALSDAVVADSLLRSRRSLESDLYGQLNDGLHFG
jgi:hypothetical protein